MNSLSEKINIQPILNDVGEIVTKGITDILYKYKINHLTRELEKYKIEVEFYKN